MLMSTETTLESQRPTTTMTDDAAGPEDDEPLYPPSNGPGRKPTIPNKDKYELRALVQKYVAEHTAALRARLAALTKADHADWSSAQIEAEVDERQPLIEEYDPVVELARIGADYSQKVELRRQANADAAQYLRAKLKSIEITEDPEKIANEAEQNDIADRLTQMLHALYSRKSTAAPMPPTTKKAD